MKVFLWILIFFGTFSIMEFMAWFTHKYIMHGLLWNLHEDHHQPTGKLFQKNDLFFFKNRFSYCAFQTLFWCAIIVFKYL